MRRLSFLLLLALPLAAQAQPATPPPAQHTILVRGSAEQEVEPERLDLLLTYRFSDNVKDNDRTQEQELALREVVRQAGIAPEKLTLEELSATGYGGFSKTGNTSVALTKVYRLTLNEPQKLNDLIPRLVQIGADNLRVVNLQSSRLEAVRLEVAGRAAANARQKAQAAVKQAGGQLGSVVAMVELLPNQPGDERLADYRLANDKSFRSKNAYVREESIVTPNLRKILVETAYDVVFEVK